MGYCYDSHNRLCCDGCGRSGGVRRRTCPHTVLGDSLRSPGGHRPRMPFCYPPALCADCYRSRGGQRGVHGNSCKDGAASSQAAYDKIEAELDAGELFVVSASTVSPGLVEVTFWGRGCKPEVKRQMPAEAYDFRSKPRLSDYAEIAA